MIDSWKGACGFLSAVAWLTACDATTSPPKEPRRDASASSPTTSCDNPTITHATLYPKPGSAPLLEATIELRDGVIARIATETPGLTDTSPSRDATQPPTSCVLDVGGRVVVAGFWNAHVHFTDHRFGEETSAAPLVFDMLVRRGFTSVVDTGADPRILYPFREAIRAGRIVGPTIVVAGGSFVYEDGTPSYLPKGLLPEVTSVEQAKPAVNAALRLGADGIKIFSGSFQTATHTIYLPPEVIAAITEAAHEQDAFVISHPTDRTGLVNAVDNGVDVLAHTAPPAGQWEPELLERMRERGVALIPTLKLWRWELDRLGVPDAEVQAYLGKGVTQLRDYHRAGGEILFGTDVGYMTDFDTREEFELMGRAGLDFHDILASLTVNPARRFSATLGTIAVGQPADLVVLGGDPLHDVGDFANVETVIRAGKILFLR